MRMTGKIRIVPMVVIGLMAIGAATAQSVRRDLEMKTYLLVQDRMVEFNTAAWVGVLGNRTDSCLVEDTILRVSAGANVKFKRGKLVSFNGNEDVRRGFFAENATLEVDGGKAAFLSGTEVAFSPYDKIEFGTRASFLMNGGIESAKLAKAVSVAVGV